MVPSTPGPDPGPLPSLEGPPTLPADSIMADAPPIATAASVSQRTSTPQRNGTTSSALPAVPTPTAEADFPTRAPPHGARCRQYLNEKVTSVLLAGMKRVAAEQPDDPLRMLGEFLLAKSREIENTKQ